MKSRLLRFKHDFQYMPWPSRMGDPDWNPGFNGNDYPEVLRGFTLRNLSGDAAFKYSPAQALGLAELNSLEAWEKIIYPSGGLFNKRSSGKAIPADLPARFKAGQAIDYDGEAVAEPVFPGGNMALAYEWSNKSVRVATMNSKNRPPYPVSCNWWRTPYWVSKFTSITRKGKIGKAFGLDAYYYNLSESGYLWVDRKAVEFFPKLPMEVRVGLFPLRRREDAGKHGQPVGWLLPGQRIRILEYIPFGDQVWAMTKAGDYICLEIFNQFFTSWRMETMPPKAPARYPESWQLA